MTLKEFIDNLNKLAEENPEALDMDVVTSADDEGNWFNEVHCPPTIGVFKDGEFCEPESEDEAVNAVCVN